MFTVYSGYSPIDSDKKSIFFAGANTDRGFISSYDTIANEDKLERLYIIKGGSGTGKSSFMKYAAEKAEKKGFKTEYYLCGSDSDSLDCVKLDDRIAVIDGTAPHVRDMKYPGAASSLIDVSQFWNSEKLEKYRGDIVNHCKEKTTAYSGAYKFLSAASILYRDTNAAVETIYLTKKADSYIDRFISRLPEASSKAGKSDKLYSHGITMKGMKKSDSIKNSGDVFYTVSDFMCAAPIFMNQLAEKLIKNNYNILLTCLPVSDVITGILIRDCGIVITVGEKNEGEKCVNMARFVEHDKIKSVRGKLRLNAEILESTVSEAVKYLGLASEHHFALEEIYISCMDFKRLTEYRNNTADDIVSLLIKDKKHT